MKIIGIDQSLSHTAITVFKLKSFEIEDYEIYYTTDTKKSKSINFNSFNIHQILVSKSSGMTRILKIVESLIYQSFFIKDGDEDIYLALEGGAFSASGSLFNLGQLSGILQYISFKNGINIREYEPTKIKLFATGKGSGDKLPMLLAFQKEDSPLSREVLSYYNDVSVKSPALCDIIDSYYIAKLLYTEILLRYGRISMKDLKLHEIEVFNRVSKKYNINLLSRPFLNKDEVGGV